MKISLCTTFALLATLSALFDFALAVDSNAISPLVKTESQSGVNDEVRTNSLTSFEAERFVGWVRLQERSTRKVFFVANHHGPLDINTGG